MSRLTGARLARYDGLKSAQELLNFSIVLALFALQTLNRGELLIMTDKQLSESTCLQEVAMNLLATGYSLDEAAQVLGITPSAIYNWCRRDSSFRTTLRNLRKQAKQKKQRD